MLREVIRRYLKHTESNLVMRPRIANQRRAIQRTSDADSAVGVNHIWIMGQYNKWKQFGLYWHGCLDGFTGKILWLVVWWNTSNPKYVCAQHLKAIKTFGGMFVIVLSFLRDLSKPYIGAPLITHSNQGTENFNVAHAQTHIRHALDPTLAGTIQHHWGHGQLNVKCGQMWTRFRRTWVPGFEQLLEKGVNNQWYDNANIADR
jgi:hypothetical protein